jgi:hypothetical protein
MNVANLYPTLRERVPDPGIADIPLHHRRREVVRVQFPALRTQEPSQVKGSKVSTGELGSN